jgi:DNA repair protein RecO (recombination protein O)
MQKAIRGIVIHTFPYSDRKSVCRIFTRECGLKAFLVSLSGRRRGSNLFQPVNQISFQARMTEGRGMSPISNPELTFHYQHIPFDPVKSCVALFVDEFLHRTLQDDYTNELLFDFLSDALILLDEEDRVSNFPIWFILSMTRLYGFEPALQQYTNRDRSTFNGIGPDQAGAEIRTLFSAGYSEVREMQFTSSQRRQLLTDLVHYLMTHLGNEKELNSLSILHDILRG